MRSLILGLALVALSVAGARADISLSRINSQNGPPIILVEGTFAYSDDPAALAREVAATGARLISFNSSGGNIVAAMAYGRMIRSLGLSTIQPRATECASACALAFVGGVARVADPGAIGVHQSSFAPDSTLSGHEAVAAVQQLTAQIIAYLIEMGVDPALLQLSLSIPANDMRYLTSSEMAVYKITYGPAAVVPSVSVAENPAETPSDRETAKSLEGRALSVMAKYHDAWSRSNNEALAAMEELYDGTVVFYGKPTSREDVLAEKRKFAERWPLRAYSVLQGSELVECTAQCTVSGVVEWFAESPARSRMSSGSAEFTLVWDPSSNKIVSESGKVIATDRGVSEPVRILAQWRGQAAKCRDELSNPAITSGACDRSGAIASKLTMVHWCQDLSAAMRWRRCRSTEMASIDPAVVEPVMPKGVLQLDPSAYPAASKYSGKTKLPDFKGRDRDFNQFRTRIREGMREGPNFAGRYSLIQIGCGTGCSFAIVGDNKTGKPSRFPRGDDPISMLTLKFRLDSRLLVAQWGLYDQNRCFMEYFDFDGTTWTTLKKQEIGTMDVCYKEISDNLR
ncbi:MULTISPECIES: hypothetical protein [unclassified Ensifer]|uniref:COG3904 family protein n=1 Tax=unclassified Ensifer TaxID=2633371 RepID=UPI001FEDB329|nr:MULTISPECIES: hypothetical protein [unclassified Ensifer]